MSKLYKEAGVDLSAGYAAVKGIKEHVARTARPEVLGELGGFGGMFALPVNKYKKPVLISGTDGVGTKLKLAFSLKKHDTVGIDLVAMCANDVVAQGAEPLFFLDYFATGKVEVEVIDQVVKGIADGCIEAGCALVGGETAEMPGFYPDEEYDLAGFCVGIVEQDQIITGSSIKPGDVMIGLASSGVHSNGFSLARKILADQIALDREVGLTLLTPTRIYVKALLALIEKIPVAGVAHITGGGWIENIPRILPEDCSALVKKNSWPISPIFNLIQSEGNVELSEMFNVFNMGIGMVVVVKPEVATEAIELLNQLGEKAYLIGSIVPGHQQIIFEEGI